MKPLCYREQRPCFSSSRLMHKGVSTGLETVATTSQSACLPTAYPGHWLTATINKTMLQRWRCRGELPALNEPERPNLKMLYEAHHSTRSVDGSRAWKAWRVEGDDGQSDSLTATDTGPPPPRTGICMVVGL